MSKEYVLYRRRVYPGQNKRTGGDLIVDAFYEKSLPSTVFGRLVTMTTRIDGAKKYPNRRAANREKLLLGLNAKVITVSEFERISQ